MRITNQMMVNSTMANIQTNKNQLNTLDEQLASQKKISKPSDDPIIAIRALRLRSSLDQVKQYLDKNIPDASSWLDTTEGALDEANSILQNLYGYCTQGASDSYSAQERQTLATTLTKLKEAFYVEGDVDYAGRYCFTGYMTDTPLNYQSDEEAADVDYIITQSFTRDDLDIRTAYKNFYQTSDILNLTVDVSGEAATNSNEVRSPEIAEVHRVQLAYKGLKEEGQIEYKDKDNNVTKTLPLKIKYTDANGVAKELPADPAAITITTDNGRTVAESNNYVPGDDEVAYNPTTGELLLGENVYKALYDSTGFEFTYEKDNFIKGDQNPVMYFDCVNNNTNDKNYCGVEYLKKDEDIEYNINFSQKLKVNTEAKDAFDIYLGRDIDDLITSVNNVLDIENQIAKVESMLAESQYQDTVSQKKLTTIKDNLTKHKELAEEEMTKAFEKGVGAMMDYQQKTSLAKADVGNRMTRLNLTKTRLTEQKTNFENLKSENEDIDLEEVVVGYSAAQLVYNASLTAASKVVQQTLLDFL